MNRRVLLDVRNAQITACRRCSRLVEWCEQAGREKRRAYREWDYWAKPVPDFGDPNADRLIVGLAPAAHGGNRTGAMFHGDRSGEWLYRALHKAGVAKLPKADRIEDGQELHGVLITATCHCAPPDNKPTLDEIGACREFLHDALHDRPWRSILCLGGIAWDNVLRGLGERRVPFGHGTTVRTGAGVLLVATYHPSQQNTFTGRLTEPMLDEAIRLFLSS